MTPGMLDRYLRGLEASDAFAGVVWVTVGGDERFAAAYGLASRAWGVPNTLDTRFDTASTTKLFTAVATLQQVDAGAFGLDTSAIGYLGLEGTAISPDVTVRHLLTHSAGIGDDADEEAGESFDRAILDLPEPWAALPALSRVLVAGGIVCGYLPTTIQVQQLVLALEGCGYDHLETFEVLHRSWHVTSRSVRPDHRMVAHTGFLTVARKIGP